MVDDGTAPDGVITLLRRPEELARATLNRIGVTKPWQSLRRDWDAVDALKHLAGLTQRT